MLPAQWGLRPPAPYGQRRIARIAPERHFSPWRDSIEDDWVEMSEMSPRERYDRYNHPWEERLVGKEYICICIYVYK
jgi:hypothetical protein